MTGLSRDMNGNDGEYHAKKKYTGDVAQNYDALRAKKVKSYDAQTERVKEYLAQLPPASVVLDLPVGTGRFLDLYQSCKAVIGIDISPDMLSQAKQKAASLKLPFTGLVADALATTLEPGSVDYVITNKFVKWLPDIHHFERLLAEVHRVCRKGMLVEIKLTSKQDLRAVLARLLGRAKERRGVTRFSQDEVRAAAQKAGFEVVKCVPLAAWSSSHYFWLVRKT